MNYNNQSCGCKKQFGAFIQVDCFLVRQNAKQPWGAQVLFRYIYVPSWLKYSMLNGCSKEIIATIVLRK